MDCIVNPLSPIVREGCHTLILGTMASPKSREVGFHYGHPQNRFWRVLSAVYGCDVPKNQTERETLLLDNGVALWDVLASCEIAGASDASIREPVANDVAALIRRYGIERIFTTGQTAAKLYRKLLEKDVGLACTALPSPSPANCAVPFEKMVEAYRVLKR